MDREQFISLAKQIRAEFAKLHEIMAGLLSKADETKKADS